VAYVAAPGSYAAERNVSAHFVVKLPDDISYETAAGMMLKGMTAEYLLFRSYQVKKGDTILVQAAAGGVGLILCQWARSLGATVIGTVGSADKAELAKAHGAHHTILYRTEDFAAKVKEITGASSARSSMTALAQATFPAALDCLRPFGTFVSFGSASGPIAAFDIGLLAKKGSLFATRPTLFTFLADRPTGWKAWPRACSTRCGKGDVKIPVTGATRWPMRRPRTGRWKARQTTGSIIFVP
jgi:NADPH2:quinone reductase